MLRNFCCPLPNHNGDVPFGIAYHHIKALPADSDNHTRTDNRRINAAAAQQKLFSLPAPAHPRARRIGRGPQKRQINQTTHAVRPARRDDVLRPIHLYVHKALICCLGMLR